MLLQLKKLSQNNVFIILSMVLLFFINFITIGWIENKLGSHFTLSRYNCK